jgi:hypothetical protein
MYRQERNVCKEMKTTFAFGNGWLGRDYSYKGWAGKGLQLQGMGWEGIVATRDGLGGDCSYKAGWARKVLQL